MVVNINYFSCVIEIEKIGYIYINKYCLIAVHKTVHDFIVKKTF